MSGESPPRSVPDRDDLRLDYEKTIDIFKVLADIRFKLLALVPSVVGAAVALMSNRSDPQTTLAVAALGLVATLGVLIYELRNSHLYNWAIHRAKYLESELQLPASVAPPTPLSSTGSAPLTSPSGESTALPDRSAPQPRGGLFTERPPAGYRLFRGVTVQHDRGLAFVYAAAFAGWAYLLVHSGFTRLGRAPAFVDALSLLGGLCIGALVWTEIVQHDRKQGKPIAPGAAPKALEGNEPKPKRDVLPLLQAAAASLLVVAVAALLLSPRALPAPSVATSSLPEAVDRLAAAIAVNASSEKTAGPVPVVVGDRSWLIFGLASLAVVVGALLLLFGSGGVARAAGLMSMLGGLTANGYLVKDLKLESLVKLDNKFDIKAQIEAEFGKLGTLGPERLLRLERFVAGTIDLEGETKDKDAVKEAVADVCARWREHKDGGNRSLMIVVGATDRIPLTSSARKRYESNVGLARARAERVKAAMIEERCGVPRDSVLSLVSGPRTTPEVAAVRAPAPRGDGYPEDRSVEVWAFWSLPPRQR